MAKNDKKLSRDEQIDNVQERLTAARQARLAAYKAAQPDKTDQELRDAFQVYWATERHKYGRDKDIEQVLWLHLKATKNNTEDKFEAGILHFGLKKLK